LSPSESIRLRRSRSERALCARRRCALRKSGLALVCLIALLPGTSRGAAEGGEKLVESVAAQVGNEIVLQSEVMELAAPIEERMRQAGAPEAEIAMVRRQALERLIETKLLSSVVERLELSASREEVDEAIAAIAGENGLSVEQLLASVASHGLAIDEYREKIRGEIERSKVIGAMVRSRVQIEEEEIRALYEEQFSDQRSGGEEVYVRHLVVLTEGGFEPRSLDAACDLARAARARIESGEVDFTQVAQRLSDMNAQRGGDLGWMHREELAPWMAQRVDAMQPGDLSAVIEMPFGCNLLELVDRREFRPVTFADAEPQLRSILYQRKTESEYVKWLDVLREQTFIERKGAFAAGGFDG
jgi:peptidyl-prolyl cis-trans isomerase SurA